MYFLVLASILLYKFCIIKTDDSLENKVFQVQVSDVADEFISLLENKNHETERIKDLKYKLAKIDTYVLDRDKYFNRILLEAQLNELNATNFHEALLGKDAFQHWRNESKNLYLKLKEKMNRDDVLSILSDRGKKKTQEYARRMMSEGYRPSKQRELELDEAVDKYLGENAIDNHQFNEERYSRYWDPQGEILDRLDKFSGRRIFKGERTNIKYYPFVVSIQIMRRFWCGGVIYWSDLVITSASCLQLMHNNRFFRENPRSLAVRIGSNHSRIGGEVIEAQEVYFHPAYDPKTLRNNIAVIRLQRQIKFSYHRVPKIIEVVKHGMGMASSATVMLLGWGVTKNTQKMSFEPVYLQTKLLPVYPNKFCKEVYGEKFITETMFCAGTFTTGEGACEHDAGGPAILSGKLVGIISFGPSICGFHDAPTVFTLVGAYLDWIETINETMPSYYRGSGRTSTTVADPFLEYFTKGGFTYRPPDYNAAMRLMPLMTVPPPKTTTTKNKLIPVQPTSPSVAPANDYKEWKQKQKGARKSKGSNDISSDDISDLPPSKRSEGENKRRKSFKISPMVDIKDEGVVYINSRRHRNHGSKGKGKKKKH